MQKNLKTYLPVAIFILTIIIVAILAYLVFNSLSAATATGNNNAESQKTNVPAENSDAIPNIDQQWTKGNPDGKIKVIEYSDFQCPYCKKGNDTIEELYQKYQKDMYITFSNFPLSSIHPYALPAAEAAEAAGYQGKFWEMHDLLFANQSNLTPADIQTYAKKLNLDMDKFNSYLSNTNIADKIAKEVKSVDGVEFDEIALDDKGNIVDKGKAKIEGTPAFLINGKLVVGAYPIDQFEKFILNALKSK